MGGDHLRSLTSDLGCRVVLADGSEVVHGDASGLQFYLYAEPFGERGHAWAVEVVNAGPAPAAIAEIWPYEVSLGPSPWSDSWMLRHGCVSPGDPVAWVDLSGASSPHPESDRFCIEAGGTLTVTSETLAGLVLPDASMALLAFTTLDRQATRIVFTLDRAAGEFRISARSILGHVVLAPGERIRSETFAVEPTDDLWASQCRWANDVGKRYGAMTITGPQVGWSDWQYYRREVTQADVEENLKALTSREWGVEYLLVDDGFQAGMSDWLTPNERWPDGVWTVARRTREAGLTPGLWIAPLTTSEHGRLPAEHPEWLVKGADGGPLENRSHMGVVYAIDYSRPEPVEWLKGLVRTLVGDWGVGWVKLDGPILRYYDGARFSDPKATPVGVIRVALGAVRDAVEEAGGAVIEGEGYYGPSVGMVHTQRVTQDIQTAWPRLRHTTYTNMMSCFTHGRLWTNNPDAFILRDTPSPACDWDGPEHVLSPDELEHEITALAMTGGVVMLTDRMSQLSPERAELIRAFIPPWGGAAWPVRFEPGEWSPATWRLGIGRDFESWWVIASFNWSDDAVPFELDVAAATRETGPWHVFDYWQRRYLGLGETFADGIVRPHGVRLVCCRLDAGRPQLVGTDIHVTQGGIEMESVEWDDAAGALRMREVSPVRESARIFVRVPEGFRPCGSEGPDGMLLDGPDPAGILTVTYRASGPAEVVVGFERCLPEGSRDA